jgi:hypothetical protein
VTLDELRESDATVLTPAQTADVLRDVEGHRLDERTVRRAAETGQIPCVRVGRRLLIPRLPLLAMLEGGPDRPPDENEGRPPQPPFKETDTGPGDQVSSSSSLAHQGVHQETP